MAERLKWIDKAKGIGIILVILGHITIPNELKILLYSFHMPLFFFLAGYVYKYNDSESFKNYLIKKAKTLLIPAYFFTIINIFWNFINSILSNNNYNVNIPKKILGIVIQMRGFEFSTDGWFLICMFTSQIIMYFIVRRFKSNKQLIIIATLLSILGWVYCKNIGIVMPWAIEVSLNATAFLIIGYVLKININKCKNIFSNKMLLLYGLVNVISTFLNYNIFNTMLDMHANNYGNYILYIMAAFSGICFTVTLCKNIINLKYLECIGKNSLIYYCLHFSVINSINLFNINISNATWISNLVIGMIYLSINLIVLHFISSFINSKASFILGRFKFNIIREREVNI